MTLPIAQFVDQPIKQEFLCRLCKEPWDPSAVTQCTECRAPFCKACYDESMMKNAKCAACEKEPTTFGDVHRLVLGMAGKLKVYCSHKAHGCGWTGTRAELPLHVDSCACRPKQFNYVSEAAIPEELMCPICSEPFVDPVQLPCEHVFCRHCITKALQRAPCCPIDRAPATPELLCQPPSVIQEILDDLPVYCANKGAKPTPCEWTGRRRDYLGHRAQCKLGQPSSSPLPAASDLTKMSLESIAEFPTILAYDSSQEIYALAHLTAPQLKDLEQRKKPLSISVAVDVSGSMAGAKLAMVKESLMFMLDELSERDELGIITFHTDVAELFPLTRMTGTGKEYARAAVSSLQALNRTNLSGGLFASVDQVQGIPFVDPPMHHRTSRRVGFKPFVPSTMMAPPMAPRQAEDSCRAVMLFTDGIANGGITEETAFIVALRDKLAASQDMVVHTFGFGSDHNAGLLQRLSQTGEGSYYFVKDVAAMKASFADCLGGLLSTVCQNIELRIKAADGFAIDRVMTTLKCTTQGETRLVKIHDVYSTETRDVLVKLKMIRPGCINTEVTIASFEVEYDSLISGKRERATQSCAVKLSETPCALPANAKVEEQRARILATEALQAARDEADRGDVSGARRRLRENCVAIRKKCTAKTAYLEAVMDEVEDLDDCMQSSNAWVTRGSQAAAAVTSCHAQQRANFSGPVSQPQAAFGYDNSFKCAMRKKAK